MAFQLPDPTTPFGERIARRLRDDPIIWLTTVDSKNTPQPNPVWFLWDTITATILVYSKAGAKRHTHLQKNPRVSLNFDSNGTGGNIIVLTGKAHLSPDDPSADHHPVFVAKYQDFITRSFSIAENFAVQYPVALRISLLSLRGFNLYRLSLLFFSFLISDRSISWIQVSLFSPFEMECFGYKEQDIYLYYFFYSSAIPLTLKRTLFTQLPDGIAKKMLL